MDLPSIISADLKNVAIASHDNALYEMLLNSTERLIRFFSYAADDETWSNAHEAFFRLTLNWCTNQYAQNRLGENYAKVIVNALHEHHAIIGRFFPKTIEVEIGGDKLAVNPMVIGVMSPFFKNLIRKEGQDRNVRHIVLHEKDLDLVIQVLNYLETANAENLWRYERDKITQLLLLAEKWEIEGFAKECEDVLKRYLSFENVEEELIQAFKNRRKILLQRAIEIFNEKFSNAGKVTSSQSENLTFEFFNFDDSDLAFRALKNEVTHLHFGGNLPLDERFIERIKESKKLRGLILSQSNEWSPLFQQIPSRIQDIDLSLCSWLGDRELRLLTGFIASISCLSLAQNTQLTYRGFSELKKFQDLRILNVSRCQLDSETLGLILQGAPSLIELNLYGCRKLTDEAFYEIGRRVPHLQKLIISRTQVTDGALIDIALKCAELTYLELNHCLNLSEMGLFDVLKKAKSLRWLSVKENHLDLTVISSLQKSYPLILIIF